MSVRLKRVAPGQPLQISAASYNAMLSAAEDFLDSQFDNSASTGPERNRRNDLVLVLNSTTSNLDRSDILGISAPLILPSDNESGFLKSIAFEGVVPDASFHSEKFIVLAEPIPAGKIGKGWVSGLAQVRIEVVKETDSVAGIVTGGMTSLKSGMGSIPIVWKESGVGVNKFAVIRFGASASIGGESAFAIVYQTYSASSVDRLKIDVREVNVGDDGVVVVDESIKTIYAWPHLLSENYKALEWRGPVSPISPGMIVIVVRKIGRRFYAEQWSGLRFRLRERDPNVRITDCIPIGIAY